MTDCIHTNIINNAGSLSEVFILMENGTVRDVSNIPQETYRDYMDSIMGSCFFNIHCHLGESLYHLDLSRRWDILKYIKYTEDINSKVNGVEKEVLWNKSAVLTASKQSMVGVTGICAARSAKICRRYNLNCMSGYPIMNSKKLIEYLARGICGFIECHKNDTSDRCSVGIFFHSLYSNDSQSLLLAKQCMDNGAEFLTIHLSEDEGTRKLETKTFNKQPAKVLDDFGLLNERTIIVHGGYLSNKELELISKRNATIAICPISNKFLNTKLPDLITIRDLGINWCIATDGLSTGRSFSIIEQIQALREIYPNISPLELYNSCTTNCAKLFNRNIYTGHINIGTEAKFLRYSITNKDNILNHIFSQECKSEIISF